MSTNEIYVAGTLLSWCGWVAAARAVYLAIRLALGSGASNRSETIRGLGIAAIAAGLLLGLMAVLPMQSERPAGTQILLPIFWLAMPFVAWLGLAAIAMIVFRLYQASMAVDSVERKARFVAVGGWLLAGIVGYWLYSRDPSNTVQVFKGAIPLSFEFVGAVILLSIAGVVVMAAASRWASGRGYARTFGAQTALIAGSIVFGLPFAFLVSTSFKEDRDMSSSQGIVWVPRVQEMVPYMDPKFPLYATVHDGESIVAKVIDKNPDGSVHVEVQEPRAILGTTFDTQMSQLKQVPGNAKLVTVNLTAETGPIDGKTYGGVTAEGFVAEDLEDGSQRVEFTAPPELKGKEFKFKPGTTDPVRHVGLRWQNYTEALSYLPPETNFGLVYVRNTLLIVIFSVVGTILSSSIVAYAFSRMKFPGQNFLFILLMSTMMLPAAVTMLPQFLIFRWFGWIDTLYPLWVPAFFASAFNVFLLRQFFKNIPMELEDASKIDGASYLRTFWTVMLPQIKPALAVIAIWTFMGAWNNFMGPLIYINSPEKMPLSYALQLFQGDRGGEPGLLMAFATMTIVPVLLLFFFAQRYFIDGVTLTGFGGR
jgi:multiple sugar transport system permease protein